MVYCKFGISDLKGRYTITSGLGQNKHKGWGWHSRTWLGWISRVVLLGGFFFIWFQRIWDWNWDTRKTVLFVYQVSLFVYFWISLYKTSKLKKLEDS